MADAIKTVEKEMEHRNVFFLVKVEYIVTDTDHDLQIIIYKYNDVKTGAKELVVKGLYGKDLLPFEQLYDKDRRFSSDEFKEYLVSGVKDLLDDIVNSENNKTEIIEALEEVDKTWE